MMDGGGDSLKGFGEAVITIIYSLKQIKPIDNKLMKQCSTLLKLFSEFH